MLTTKVTSPSGGTGGGGLLTWIKRIVKALLLAGAAVAATVAAGGVYLTKKGRMPEGMTAPWQQHPDWVSAFRMKDRLTFAIVVWGTRGDVQPVLILAQELRARGHTVRLAIPPEHMHLAAQYGLEEETRALVTGVSMADAADAITEAFSGGDAKSGKSKSPFDFFRHFFNKAANPLFDAWMELTDGADVMIGQLAPMTTEVPLAISRHRQIPLVFTAHDPMVIPSPRAALAGDMPGESGIFHIQVVSHMFGRLGRAAVRGMYERLGLPTPWLHEAVPLPLLWSIPLFVTFPQALFPVSDTGAPAWWYQTGAWRAAASATDEAMIDPALAEFVTSGEEAPIFVGFGSLSKVMVKGSENRAQFTRALLQGLVETGHSRLVVQGGSIDSSVPVPQGVQVFEADYLPHEWLFPRCKAAFVHGGAGTTAAAVAAGIPVVVVPATPLQMPWGGLIKRAGVGTTMAPKDLTDVQAWATALATTQQKTIMSTAARLGSDVAAARSVGVQRSVDALLGDLGELDQRNRSTDIAGFA